MITNFGAIVETLKGQGLSLDGIEADKDGVKLLCRRLDAPVNRETLAEFFGRLAEAYGKDEALSRLNADLSLALGVTLCATPVRPEGD